MKRAIIGAVALALAAMLTACGGPGNITAHGTETVAVGIFDGQSAQDTYPDVTDGGQVTVVDSSGTNVIGTGTLSLDSSSTFDEEFKFTVTVPGGLVRYGIQIGNNRGTVWFSEKQMKQGPGLCLGDGC